jgi:hypothetical protein
MSNELKISGTIGIKILYNKKINKKIFIFYDDHSNKKYCKPNNDNNNLFISELFDEIKNKDIAMILEEPFIENNTDTKIKILWEDTTHLMLFRKFYTKLMEKCSNKKICKIFPVDIRLSIFDISPDEIILNISKSDLKYNIKVEKYFENIYYLFDLENVEIKSNSICIFLKKVFNVYKNSDYYKQLKKRIIDFIQKYNLKTCNETIFNLIKKNMDSSNFIYEEGFPFVNTHNNFIDDIDKISSGIMELYSIILIILLPNKNIIYYAGYYHSNNIAYLLQTYYDFGFEYSFGATDNIENKNKISNCIIINKNKLKLIS